MSSTSRIDIRLTDEQKEKIRQKAEATGLDISGYIKFVALNAEIKVTVKKSE